MAQAEARSEADKAQIRIYQSMSPAQKWAQVLKLRATAWELKRARLRSQHPEWTDVEIEDAVKKVFLYATT